MRSEKRRLRNDDDDDDDGGVETKYSHIFGIYVCVKELKDQMA